jgi:aminoglycoside phosphotransferase family enzyme/predicted kinase
MQIPEQQLEVAAFLSGLTASDPAQTHISAVFVGRNDVYKLKKAVRLTFLDFSALAARAAMARQELALNRVAAPEIYHDVLAIVRGSDGRLRLAPEDAPQALDYVVHMAPIPHGDFLDRIVARGALTPALLDALGDCVATLHGRLKPLTQCDSVARMRRIIDGNVAAARAAGLEPATIERWHAAIFCELDRIKAALAAREAAGCVRRLHGDLHLGNICLWQGKPAAFDMLEFDEDLAIADVGYDLAFLLMDLSFHAGDAAANRVMNRYLARTGDPGVLTALPCFMSVRAIVRAHVQASRGETAEAARYVQVALGSLRPVPAVMVAVGGLQGSGKTTLARAVAPELGRPPGAFLLRSDETRKRLFGALPEEKLGAEAYSPGANARVNAAVIADAGTALRAGQAVVVDSTFLHQPMRHAIESAARTGDVTFVGLWLEADLDVLLDRVAARTGDASDAGPEVVRQAATVDPGHITWIRLPAGDGVATLARARRELPVRERSETATPAAQFAAEQGSFGHGRHDDDG